MQICDLLAIGIKSSSTSKNSISSRATMDHYGYDIGLRELQHQMQSKRDRRREFYSNCRKARREQFQEPSTKYKTEKSRELLRCVYPANPSGSKAISIGLDPALDFEPVVNLYKAGFPGVRFESNAFDDLCANADFIRNYFQGQSVEGTGQLQFANNVSMKFTTCIGKPSVEFTGANETANERRVIITAETWLYIYDMLPLLRRVFMTLQNATPHVLRLYGEIVVYARTNYHLKNSAPACILQDVKNYLNGLDMPLMTKNMAEDSGLDHPRVFYEIIHFCLYDIAGSIRLQQ
jgi:hypothetical protein